MSMFSSQYWFKVMAIRQQAITWANVDQSPCRHMASLGPNEFKVKPITLSASIYRRSIPSHPTANTAPPMPIVFITQVFQQHATVILLNSICSTSSRHVTIRIDCSILIDIQWQVSKSYDMNNLKVPIPSRCKGHCQMINPSQLKAGSSVTNEYEGSWVWD